MTDRPSTWWNSFETDTSEEARLLGLANSDDRIVQLLKLREQEQANERNLREEQAKHESTVIQKLLNQFPLLREELVILTAGKSYRFRDGLISSDPDTYSAVNMPTSEFLSAYTEKSQSRYQGILPSNCRYAVSVSGSHHFVIELPPGKHTLRTERQTLSDGYSLRMPWQYFFLTIGKGYYNESFLHDSLLFWSKQQIKSLDEKCLIPAPIPNVYADDGRICLGDTYTDSDVPIVERVNSFVKQMFSPESLFNGDLEWNKPQAYESYSAWAREKDPLCHLWWDDWDYTHRLRSIESILNITGPTERELTFHDLSSSLRSRGW